MHYRAIDFYFSPHQQQNNIEFKISSIQNNCITKAIYKGSKLMMRQTTVIKTIPEETTTNDATLVCPRCLNTLFLSKHGTA